MSVIASHYAHARKVMEEILIKGESIRFFDADVYLLDRGAFAEMTRLERWLDGECVGERQLRKFGFKTLAKIVNRGTPADRCILYRRRLYKHVVDSERVRELAKGYFEAWKNGRIAELRREVEREEAPPEAEERRMRKLVEEIEQARLRLSEAIEREEKMILTEYENSRLYPAAALRFGIRRHRVEHLSIRLPNIVWRDETFELRIQEAGGKITRRDAFIKRILRDAERIAGAIYVLHGEMVTENAAHRP